MLKKHYHSIIRTKVYMEDIPGDFIIDWDRIGLKYVHACIQLDQGTQRGLNKQAVMTTDALFTW